MNYKGNITTVIKWISMTIAGYAIGTITAHGLDLPVDSMTFSQVIAAFIFLGLGYLDAKYPNTFKFLHDDDDPIEEYPEISLNEDYEIEPLTDEES